MKNTKQQNKQKCLPDLAYWFHPKNGVNIIDGLNIILKRMWNVEALIHHPFVTDEISHIISHLFFQLETRYIANVVSYKLNYFTTSIVNLWHKCTKGIKISVLVTAVNKILWAIERKKISSYSYELPLLKKGNMTLLALIAYFFFLLALYIKSSSRCEKAY